MAVTDDALWVADARGAYLVRIDLATNGVTSTVPMAPAALASGDGQVWSMSLGGAPAPTTRTLSRVDLASGVPHELTQVQPPGNFAVGLGALWVLSGGLLKIDPTSGSTLASWPGGAADVFVGCGALWTWGYTESGSVLTPVDRNSGPRISMATGPLNIDAEPKMIGSADSCWLVSRVGVQRLLPGELADPIAVPCCGEVTVVGNALWLVAASGAIQQIDPATGTTGDGWTLPPDDLLVDAKGNPDWRLLSAGGSLWLLNREGAIRFDISTEPRPE